MSDLIRREDAVCAICEACNKEACEGSPDNERMWCATRRIIEEQEETICHCNVKENAELICKIMDYDVDNEPAPMAEVVRCKDCKYSFPNENGFCKISLAVGDPEFSCIKGERKDGV